MGARNTSSKNRYVFLLARSWECRVCFGIDEVTDESASDLSICFKICILTKILLFFYVSCFYLIQSKDKKLI